MDDFFLRTDSEVCSHQSVLLWKWDGSVGYPVNPVMMTGVGSKFSILCYWSWTMKSKF